MKELRRVCEVLQTMSNPARLRILEILHTRGKTCVCELEAALGMTQSNISFHLNLLRKDGLVTNKKVGKWVFYRLNEKAVGECLRKLAEAFGPARAGKDASHDSVYVRCNREELSRAEILDRSGAAASE
jgi:DNA-binding transcriptional ArsR family regulator